MTKLQQAPTPPVSKDSAPPISKGSAPAGSKTGSAGLAAPLQKPAENGEKSKPPLSEKPDEQRAGEQRAEQRIGKDKCAEEKRAEGKRREEQRAEEKRGEDKRGEDKRGEDKRTEDKRTEEKAGRPTVVAVELTVTKRKDEVENREGSGERAAAPVQETAEGVSAQQANRGSVSESSIRVDVGLLDKLMNLVGELVLARNQVLQFSNAEDVGITAPSQGLNLITTELQEGVMKTRMQPIGNIWSDFRAPFGTWPTWPPRAGRKCALKWKERRRNSIRPSSRPSKIG